MKLKVATVAFIVILMLSGTTGVYANGTSSSRGAPPTSLPPLPAVVGCYKLVVSDATDPVWQGIPCLPAALASALPKPTEGGGYGIEGVGGGSGAVQSGEVNIAFSRFSGESDSARWPDGTNDWSIQLNTNFFPGTNGHTDWVQFVEQNYPTYLTFFGYAAFCIWQVDVTTQSYPNTCVGTSIQTLSSSAAPFVQGYLTTSNGVKYLGGDFCQNGSTCWGVTAQDNNGLTGRWSDTSGTILGLGGGSTADFTSPTSLTTTVYLITQGNSNAFPESTYVTAEMNNLNPGSVTFTSYSNGGSTSTPSSN